MGIFAESPSCGEQEHRGVEHPLDLAEGVGSKRNLKPAPDVAEDCVERSDENEDHRKPRNSSPDSGCQTVNASADGMESLHLGAEITDLPAIMSPTDTMPPSERGDHNEFDRRL